MIVTVFDLTVTFLPKLPGKTTLRITVMSYLPGLVISNSELTHNGNFTLSPGLIPSMIRPQGTTPVDGT